MWSEKPVAATYTAGIVEESFLFRICDCHGTDMFLAKGVPSSSHHSTKPIEQSTQLWVLVCGRGKRAHPSTITARRLHPRIANELPWGPGPASNPCYPGSP